MSFFLDVSNCFNHFVSTFSLSRSSFFRQIKKIRALKETILPDSFLHHSIKFAH